MPFKSYLSCCGVKKMGLLPKKRLIGEDEEVRERGRLFSTHRLISVKHAFF